MVLIEQQSLPASNIIIIVAKGVILSLAKIAGAPWMGVQKSDPLKSAASVPPFAKLVIRVLFSLLKEFNCAIPTVSQ